MRINLQTPFADKDKAKSLGARWDATQKVWYIVDVVDLTPFMRWIPNLEAARSAAAGGSNASQQATHATHATRASHVATAVKPAKPATAAKPAFVTRSTRPVASCTCTVLPWDDCIHTTTGA